MIRKDLFINKMNEEKFKYTNKIWNDAKLNSPWSIGYVSTLINQAKFKTKEEWIQYYYESGKIRNQKIEEMRLSAEERLCLVKVDGAKYVSNDIKKLNYQYGRTRESMMLKGKLLYKSVLNDGNKLSITEKECIYAVNFRVLAETWNGIIVGEKNTSKNLEKILKGRGFEVEIVKTDGYFDLKYEVDFEIFHNDQLICGIQVKPISYKIGKDPVMIETKTLNRVKNENYTKDKKRAVHYVYSKTNGEIEGNTVIEDIIKDIRKYM